jgi:quercetin dioxygenase-like cupin family protein
VIKSARLASGIVAGSLALAVAVHAAAPVRETVKPLSRDALPNVPGKELIAVEVLFPPGVASPPHTHPAFVYAYVLSGEIVSAVGEEKPRVYRAGESWHEPPGADHRVTRNPSRRVPAKLLVVFIANTGVTSLVQPERK